MAPSTYESRAAKNLWASSWLHWKWGVALDSNGISSTDITLLQETYHFNYVIHFTIIYNLPTNFSSVEHHLATTPNLLLLSAVQIFNDVSPDATDNEERIVVHSILISQFQETCHFHNSLHLHAWP